MRLSLIRLLTLVIMATMATSIQADEWKGLSILGLISSEPQALADRAFHTRLVQEWEQRGARVNEMDYRSLTPEILAQHDIAVISIFPGTLDPEEVDYVVENKQGMLLDFVTQGGGLWVFLADQRGRHFEPLNRFLEPLGVEALLEIMHDHNPENLGVLPASTEVHLLRTSNVERQHPLTRDVRALTFTRGWQRGIWPLRLSDEWSIAVRGEATAYSRLHADPTRGTFDEAPPLIASREWGQGRVVYYPIHPTYLVLDGYHPRWGTGYLLHADDNMALMNNMIEWLAAGSQRTPRVPAPRIERKAERELRRFFETVPPEEQSQANWRPWRGIFGLKPAYQSGDSLQPWREAALEAGFDWAVFVLDGESVDEATWQAFEAELQRISGEEFLALPAADFIAANDFNSHGTAVLPTYWPPVKRNRRFVIQIIEEGGGFQIFRHVPENEVPVYNIGGVQGLELFRYPEPGGGPDKNIEAYRNLQRHDWFLAPIARHEVATPDQIALVAEAYHTYVLAPELSAVPRKVPLEEQREFYEVFVGNGPVLEQFWWESPGVINDVWEGRMVAWNAEADDVALLHMAARSDQPLSEVVLYRDGIPVRRYQPDTLHWSETLRVPNERASRNYSLEITDAAGRQAFSTARRTRSLAVWVHGGADRMNTYGGVIAETEDARYAVRGKKLDATGGVFFPMGWRHGVVGMYPPVLAVHISPAGGEYGPSPGRVYGFHYHPVLKSEEGQEIHRALPSLMGFESRSDEGFDLRPRIAHKEEGGARLETSLFDVETFFVFPRHRPLGGPKLMRMDVDVTFKRDITPLDEANNLVLLRLYADTDRFLNQWTWLDAGSGRIEQAGLPLNTDTEHRLIAPGGMAALFPQPFGSFGLYDLDGEPWVASTGVEGGRRYLTFGMSLPPTLHPQGTTIRRSVLLINPGSGKDASFFALARNRLHADSASRWQLDAGRHERARLGERLILENGVVKGQRLPDAHQALLGWDDFVTIQPEHNTWPLLLWDKVGDRHLPISNQGDRAYWTVDADLNAFALGHPFLINDHRVLYEAWPTDDAWQLVVHNPTGEVVHPRITAQPDITGMSAWERQVTLQAGESKTWRIERARSE